MVLSTSSRPLCRVWWWFISLIPSAIRLVSPRMEFFKSFGITAAMGAAMAVAILIMVKGSGLISVVPFVAFLVGFVYLFVRYGCLPDEGKGDHH